MSIEDCISDLDKKVKANTVNRPPDYYDEDGLCRCGVCNERKENRYHFFGVERVVHCLCKCDQAMLEAKQEEEKRREFARRVQSLKTIGLTEHRFREWRFENDNGKNPKLNLARTYVKNWKEMQEKNIGYVLMGPVGTGKSFFAGCIANALMEQGVSVMMTNFSRILNELTKPYADKNQIISGLVSYPLLIIDDLGIERNSEFALEMIYNIIDRRYCTKKPLIVTTNLSYQDMTRPDLDMEHRRIYSRLMEMCLPVIYQGADQRIQEQDLKMEWMKLKDR
ncbi:MAG: ATP-binding protein [Eubacteriales bacterium]|nr:ATP-binding protein [Eubacteriales bacterium]